MKKGTKQSGIPYRIILRKTPEVYDKLIRIAEREDRSVSAQIRFFIKKGVAQYDLD
tara:strand:- start:725 stop:892 length:168 start_codon:yes stop_codon:yes gene_type:complete